MSFGLIRVGNTRVQTVSHKYSKDPPKIWFASHIVPSIQYKCELAGHAAVLSNDCMLAFAMDDCQFKMTNIGLLHSYYEH